MKKPYCHTNTHFTDWGQNGFFGFFLLWPYTYVIKASLYFQPYLFHYLLWVSSGEKLFFLFCFFFEKEETVSYRVEQGLANYDPHAKSRIPLNLVNKILLEHIHLFIYCLRLLWSYNGRVEQCDRDTINGPYNQKVYYLFFRKKFAYPWGRRLTP